ncbi:MAG: hypothetical protein R6W06_00715 [Prochlorococcaceae cyanobacterium]
MAIVLAAILSILGIGRIDVRPVQSRDSLRLSSASRALTTLPLGQKPPVGVWSALRGDQLSTGEERVDRAELEQARYKVEVGVYSTSNYELDLRVPSYSGGGYVWLRWQEPMQRYVEGRGGDISRLFIVLNTLLSDKDSALRPVGEVPVRLADGSYYQLFTYVGRYYVDKASFRNYPFMTISLPLVIEANDIDGELGYRDLRLIPEIQNSGMGLYARIIGWLNTGWSIAEYRHHYATNFGLGGQENDYSQVVFEISYGTSSWSSFWRLLLPLSVLMAMVLLVFKVRPDEQDARASIPVTVLLTLVFLQQTYRDQLPDLPFLTFLDQVYVVAYGVTLAAFVLVLWIGRRYGEMEAMDDSEAKDALQRHLHYLDDIWPLMVVLFGGAAITICWMTISHVA